MASRVAATAAVVGATVALASSPASAGGGYFKVGCDAGRACIFLTHATSTAYNLDGCGGHGVGDYYIWGQAHGNSFIVHYANGRWDRVDAWTERRLDAYTVVTGVDVLC
jgi:hypothetical protein